VGGELAGNSHPNPPPSKGREQERKPFMRSPVVPVFVVCLAGGCGGGSGSPGAPADPARVTNSDRRMLSLGDSYTIGEGVPANDRWSVQLASMLRDKGIPVDDPRIIAKTGWTTANLAAAVREQNDLREFDLVTLLIGVNNQYRGRSLDEYKTEFATLLKRAVELAGNRADRVIVMSIPDYGPTPYVKRLGRDAARVGRELDQFNAANQAAAKAAGARYVEITAASRTQAADPAMLAADGLHPSGAMYKTWATAALPDAEAALAGKKE
jgi:lysophospholipase L1-like esterase